MGRIQKCCEETQLNSKALIIGYGSIGRKHSELLIKLLGKKNVYVMSSQKKIPLRKISSFKDVSLLDPDYVVIASPTYLHFEQLKRIDKLLSNKVVLIEKPLFSEKRILSLKKNTYFVGYNLRFHPLINMLKESIKKDEILQVNIICSSYLPDWRKNISYKNSYSASKKKGGGVLLDLSHEIDYLRYLVGDIKYLYSKNSKISELKIDSDDYLNLFGKIIRGGFFNINLNYFSKKSTREIFVDTKSKSVHLDLLNSQITFYYIKKNKKVIKRKYSIEKTYLEEHEAILSGDSSKICTLNESMEVMNIIDKIQKFNK